LNRRIVPIFLAFLCMGFVDGVGTFVGLAKQNFPHISIFVANLLPFVAFIGFGILSVPMGLLQDRTSKKTILLIGLIIALVGALIAFSGLKEYWLFLATVFLLGTGASVLQVAGNPIMRDVSGPEKYPRNLSIGQSIKAIGSLSGALVAVITIAGRWQGVDWQILFKIYTAILLLTVVLVALTKVPEQKDERSHSASFASCLALLSNPFILMMVLGIFVYVGTEVCISSGVTVYLGSEGAGGSSVTDWLKAHLGLAIDAKTVGFVANALFFILLFIGRSSGSVLLNWMSAAKLLVATVLVTIVGLLGLLLIHDQTAALVSIVLAGIGCANIFPLIFSITVNHMPERSNEISGLMVTAIVGGAFLPPLMGLLADHTSVSTGFLVPLACAFYLLLAGIVSLKLSAAASGAA
jgi:MFS transporter, FHS family, L-fucose permease